MNMMNKKLITVLAMFLATGITTNSPYKVSQKRSSDLYPRSGDLPRWSVGGKILYAKNEHDAIKYAKKRGLYKEGVEIKRIDD